VGPAPRTARQLQLPPRRLGAGAPDTLPHLRLSGVSAGLHALINLPEHGPTEHQVASRAKNLSLGIHTLGDHWHEPPEPAPQAVVVGYAAPASHAFRPALDALMQLLAGD
jgi:GntR family transcriptional regulator / MocR family aminotransferase